MPCAPRFLNVNLAKGSGTGNEMTKFAPGPKYRDPHSGNEWANEHTFQIAYWLLNDFEIYQKMQNFMEKYDGPIPYRAWIKEKGLLHESTPTGWKLIADEVNYGELSEIMRASKN